MVVKRTAVPNVAPPAQQIFSSTAKRLPLRHFFNLDNFRVSAVESCEIETIEQA